MKALSLGMRSNRSLPLLALLISTGLLGGTLLAWIQYQAGLEYISSEIERKGLIDHCIMIGLLSALIVITTLFAGIFLYERQATAADDAAKQRGDHVPTVTNSDASFRELADEPHEAAHNLIEGVFNASLRVSIIATDSSGLITVFNTGAERMLGYSATEMIGQKTPLYFHDVDEITRRGLQFASDTEPAPEGFEVFTSRVAKEGHYEDEWTYIHQSGKRVKINLTITAIRDEANNAVGYLGIATDITQRKQAEKALIESQLMLRNVLDNIPARVFWKDRDSVYIGGNRRFLDDAGLEHAKDLEGITDFDIGWTEQADAFRADDQEVIRSGKSKIDYEEPQTRPDGSLTWLNTSKVPLRNRHDKIIGVLGTYEDITKRKIAEEALIAAKNEAEEANKAKDDFLAVMSHEMRTPLNPILGFADILRQSIKTEPERDYLETIINSAQRQLILIDDILEFIRLNRNNIYADPEPFNLVDLCSGALHDASSTSKQIELRFENGTEGLEVSENLIVQTDLMMLRRVLDNLLSNACKYTETGSITLSVARKNASDDSFIFIVRDTGMGIDPSMCDELFEAFSQADNSYSRRHEGLGLGLAICKKLLDTLGGSISFESKLGLGSSFRVELPLKLAEENHISIDSTEASSAPAFEQALEILIADDKPDNLLIAGSLVRQFGGHVTEANNGEEAVSICKEKQFDVILMDLAMPMMNGFEAFETIRSSENLNRRTPIIAVTADVSRQTQSRCEKIGMQDYVSKPIDPKLLFSAIKQSC